MVTIDRLRGLGDCGGGDVVYCPGGGIDMPDSTNVTGNSGIWANILNTVGQLGVAFAPAVKNLTTPYATYSSVSPYGTSMSSIPMGQPAISSYGMPNLGSGLGISGGTLLLLGVGLVIVMSIGRRN